MYCKNLVSIYISESVGIIGKEILHGCYDLSSIIVSPDNAVYDSRDECNAIIETKTNTLVEGCKNTTIPNSVTNIGESAFDGCEGLTSISIPNSVVSIGESAFAGCKGLTSVSIPNSVTSIGRGAFQNCSRLDGIFIPKSVTNIGGYAFERCSKLKNVKVEWSTPISVSYKVFSAVDNEYLKTLLSDRTLYVPKGTLSKYKSADVWKEFGTIEEY